MSKKTKPSDSYEVGYGRPPEQTRFKAGQSGNPKGRPRKRLNNRTIIENLAAMKVTVNENGRPVRLAFFEVMMKSAFVKAMKGDTKATAFVLNTMDRYGLMASQDGDAVDAFVGPDEAEIIELYLQSKLKPEGGPQ